MAIFPEDAVMPVAVLGVLWVSINPKKNKVLTSMKIRTWISKLLSRSILLGSVSQGVGLHEYVVLLSVASFAVYDNLFCIIASYVTSRSRVTRAMIFCRFNARL